MSFLTESSANMNADTDASMSLSPGGVERNEDFEMSRNEKKLTMTKPKGGSKLVVDDDCPMTFPQRIIAYLEVDMSENYLEDVSFHMHALFPKYKLAIALYAAISNEDNSNIISWLPHGRGFMIYQKTSFANEIMPKFFKQSKFTSFTRKLNRWGFSRVSRGPEAGAYYHEHFLKGQPRLLMQMCCQSINPVAFTSPVSSPLLAATNSGYFQGTGWTNSGELQTLDNMNGQRFVMPMNQQLPQQQYMNVASLNSETRNAVLLRQLKQQQQQLIQQQQMLVQKQMRQQQLQMSSIICQAAISSSNGASMDSFQGSFQPSSVSFEEKSQAPSENTQITHRLNNPKATARSGRASAA
eukprot:scaffold110777_cov51-Attheya_sp.AAC.6